MQQYSKTNISFKKQPKPTPFPDRDKVTKNFDYKTIISLLNTQDYKYLLSPLLTLTEKFYENSKSKKYILYDDIKNLRNDLSHYNINIQQKTTTINQYITQITQAITTNPNPYKKLNQEAQDSLTILKKHTYNNFITLFLYLTDYIPYEFIKITLDKFIAELEAKHSLLKLYNHSTKTKEELKETLYNINILKLILFVSKNLTSQKSIKLQSNYKPQADIVKNKHPQNNPKYYKYKGYLKSNNIVLHIHQDYTGYFFDSNNYNKQLNESNLDENIKKYINSNYLQKKKNIKFNLTTSILDGIQDSNQNHITDITTIPNEIKYQGNILILDNLKGDIKLKFYQLYQSHNQDLYDGLNKLISKPKLIFMLSDKILKEKCGLTETKNNTISPPKIKSSQDLINENKKILKEIHSYSYKDNNNKKVYVYPYTGDITELNYFISKEDKYNLTNILITEGNKIFNLNILLSKNYQGEFNESKDINFLMFLHSISNSNTDSLLTATIKYNKMEYKLDTKETAIDLFASINNSNPQKEIYFYNSTHILDSKLNCTLDINNNKYTKDKKKLTPFINFIKHQINQNANKHIILIPLSTLKKELFTIIKNNYTQASRVIQQINHFEKEFFTNNTNLFKDKDNQNIPYCDFLHANLKSEYSKIFTQDFIQELKGIRNAALHFNEPKSKNFDIQKLNSVLTLLPEEEQQTILQNLIKTIKNYTTL